MNRKRRSLLLAAIGVGLLVFLVLKIGPETILSQLAIIKASLAFLILIGLVRLALQTLNWWIALRAEGVDSNPRQLMGIRLASIALSYLSSMGPVVAEPFKIALLRNQETTNKTAPATLAETAIYWFSSVLLGVAGIVSGAFLFVGGSGNTSTLWICGAPFLFAIYLLLSRRSLIGRFKPFFTRRNHTAPSWLRKGEEIEERVRTFRSRHPVATRRIFLIDIFSQLLTVSEVFVVLRAAGFNAGFLTLLGIEAVSRASKIASAWVPARIGVDESGAVAACALFGVNPAVGLTLSIARRVRDLIWCCVGLIWLLRENCWQHPMLRKNSRNCEKDSRNKAVSPYFS